MGPEGNEKEVREVVKIMAQQLHEIYPQQIQAPEQYLSFKNSEKYKPEKTLSSSFSNRNQNDSFFFLGHSVCTPQSKSLFKKLNFCVELPDYLLLSEFRSRITYLA